MGPVSICGNDAAAADVISHPKSYLKNLGDECMSESTSGKSPVHTENPPARHTEFSLGTVRECR